MAVTEDKIVPLKQLNPVQKALIRIFGIDRWMYGRRGVTKVGGGESEQLRREQMSLLMGEFTAYTQLSNDRHVKYADYDAMDEGSPEVAAVLSLYAQEATAEDLRTHRVVWINSEEKELEKKLNRLVRELNIEERAWGTVRNLAKYGDCFLLNLFADGKGEGTAHEEKKTYIRSLQYIYPGRVKRVEADTLMGYISEDLTQILPPEDEEHGMYAPWTFTHGRLMAYDQESIYGRSMCEEVRKIWKMLSILETMVALAHVQRAIDRNIFMIDVGSASEEEALALVKKYKQWLRRKEFFDPATNQFKNDFNPTTIQEDIFWPTRPNSNSRVETLQGKTVPQGLVDDLNYFRNKMCAGLGVPREYLDGTQQGSVFDSKAALVMQDIHFARKVERLQRAFRQMIHRICQVRLALDGEVTNKFEVKMESLSLISDRLNEDLWQRRAEVLGILTLLAQQMGWPQDVWNTYLTKNFTRDLPSEVLAKLLEGIKKMVPPEGFPATSPGGEKDGETGKDGGPAMQHDPKNPLSPDTSKKMPHDEFPLQPKNLFKDMIGKEATDAIEESLYEQSFGETETLDRLKRQLAEMKRSVIKEYPALENLAKAAEKEIDEEKD